MFSLDYVKPDTTTLFTDLSRNVLIEQPQNYIPIYGRFFDLNQSNFNSIQLNNSTRITNVLERKTDNTYICKTTDNEIKPLFFIVLQ